MAKVRDENLWRNITFAVADQVMTRVLVPEVQDFTSELSVRSPVGALLAGARAGDELVAATPGGSTLVRVLEIKGARR